MQTFLPYSDFERSARALDVKRLGKQRVEVIQVVRALTTPGYGWAHHPAVLMWEGHEEALGRYGLTCCAVWSELGFADTCAATIAADLKTVGVHHIREQDELSAAGVLPAWLGNEDLHRSHRSVLISKDRDHYRPVFPDDPEDVPYLWPVRSPTVVAAEVRREENRVRREQRALLRADEEAERLRKRRSRAAKKGWTTRRASS